MYNGLPYYSVCCILFFFLISCDVTKDNGDVPIPTNGRVPLDEKIVEIPPEPLPTEDDVVGIFPVPVFTEPSVIPFVARSGGEHPPDRCPEDPNKTLPGICGCGTPDVDTDFDNLADCDDNCPTVANLDQKNGDIDTRGDACDNCPTVSNPSQSNSDTDSLGDVCDNCPAVPNENQKDADGDSVGNACDNCVAIANTNQANNDADSLGNACDNCPMVTNQNQFDGDNDSVGDACDNCPNNANTNQSNSDADSLGDVCDNCPTVSNQDQTNSDADTFGNECDNCPTTTNQDQSNSDMDSHGDACDNCSVTSNEDQLDTDNDMLGDVCDNCPTATTCDDMNVCTDDMCILVDPFCSHTPVPGCCNLNSDCDDSNACTTDTCVNHGCVNTAIVGCCLMNSDCNDSDICTDDTCVNNACMFSSIAGCCIENSDCNEGGVCAPLTCVNNMCVDNSVTACNTTFAGGNGTMGNPYLVGTRDNLAHVNFGACQSNLVFFRQICDIDLGGSATPWTIFDFNGQYDGDGHAVTGLFLHSPTAVGGLFGNIFAGASVKNLSIVNADLDILAGGILGNTLNSTATVSNVSVSGTISGTPFGCSTISMGGLLAGSGGTITACSSTADVNYTTPCTDAGNRAVIGLLVGGATGTITDCFTSGTMTAQATTADANVQTFMGTLVGEVGNSATTISDSYSTGNLMVPNTSMIQVGMGFIGIDTAFFSPLNINRVFSSGTYTIIGLTNKTARIGGIIGFSVGTATTISDSYSMVTIDVAGVGGSSAIGGFLGFLPNPLTLNTNYSAAVSITANAGTVRSFIGGTANVTATDNYVFENGSVPVTECGGTCTGLTTFTTAAQMETQSNFVGFDFSTPIWRMPSANPLSPASLLSPVLDWQCDANGIVCP